LGNSRSKVVSFHRGKNAIHDNDREKGSSIVANLNLSKADIRKVQNAYQKSKAAQDATINLDKKSLRKLG
jgi:hypothetical protein